VFQESLLGRNIASLRGLASADFKMKKKKKKNKRNLHDELRRNGADDAAIPTVVDRQEEEVEGNGAACKAVFETTELLENILVHLPPREILKSIESPDASEKRRFNPCPLSKRCFCD
jgi:hypothetical protein